ncbi:MAG: hypothetical protein E6970_01865 [Peptostreptococcus sp.]|uniref:hypothetical protein n=1 Tax=Peptostreptococcus sp. TaxID=1262 RepID=UPI001D325DD6|nr:hypothetical protein [Peptostreptococcus sp.]MBS5596619.1 hypothetical protein [Peptostreptococcus sp.]MDU1264551.1 hypothetical protein [Peptostreptococcus sp.]
MIGRIFKAYERNGLIYRISEDKKIDILSTNILASIELTGMTEDRKINLLQNSKEDKLFTEEGIESLGELVKFEELGELFKENDDE